MAYENVAFETEDGERLTGWFIPVKGITSKDEDTTNAKKAATILYFHANAGNMGFRLPFLEKMHQLLPCNILIISYRGYGKSTGKPTEDGVYKDADAALKFLNTFDNIDPERVIVFGRSLGGAVAVNLTSRHPDKICGLILENTFTSISAMADKLFPFLYPVKPFILRLDFPSLTRIQDIKNPILFVSGLTDEVVPAEHMQSLFDSADRASRRVILRVPGGMHNDTWLKAGPKYFEVMRDFIHKAIPEAPIFVPRSEIKQPGLGEEEADGDENEPLGPPNSTTARAGVTS
eukprot:CAMPEP_0170175230 /NCGR_PEP_ID=MMETSP0040_2-20121228/8346_1 /TAXON_ID=641309 /ORGANISM="Lotharella oceanica, Strain CCMP622" /LENGTH=289 /DNA_ID=CAMNT_0010417145 /DNA_START=82 /DNA_END=951 /DNA_ORIENTATION=+